MVQNVKKLGTKLRVKPIRNLLDVVVLENRKIEGQKARPDQRISPKVPTQRDRIRNGKALGFDVVNWIPRIDCRTAPGAPNQIGDVDVWVGTFDSECVPTKTSGKGNTSAGREYSPKLPSSDCPTCHSRRPFRRADLPVVIDLEIVGNIEIRQPAVQLWNKPEWAGNGIRVFIPNHAP